MKVKYYYLLLLAALAVAIMGCTKEQKDKTRPGTFSLETNELSIIENQTMKVMLHAGKAPYQITRNESLMSDFQGDVLSLKALHCKESGIRPQTVDLLVSDAAGHKCKLKVHIFKALDVDMSPLALIKDETQNIRINAGNVSALKLESSDKSVATAEIVTETVQSIDLKRIQVKALGVGETTISVSDGVTAEAKIKVVVEEKKAVKVLGPDEDNELVPITEFELKGTQTFIITGGNGEYVLTYDNTKLVVGDVQEYDTDSYSVMVAVHKNVTESEEVTLTVAEKGHPDNKTVLKLKLLAPLKIRYQIGQEILTAKTDPEDASIDLLEIKTNTTLNLRPTGLSGNFLVLCYGNESDLVFKGLETKETLYGPSQVVSGKEFFVTAIKPGTYTLEIKDYVKFGKKKVSLVVKD